MLNVRMLGTFVVSFDDTAVVEEKNRRSKSLNLLQYLFAKPGKMIGQEELIDLLLGEDDCGDPVNTLKNIVYRARKLFADAGIEGHEFIIAKSGAYGLNTAIPRQIDAEEFEHTILRAKTEENQEKKLELYIDAIRLYGGDYLPREYMQPWAVAAQVRYQEAFRQAVQEAYAILVAEGDIGRALDVTAEASTLYPLEEEFHRYHIDCLCKLGRVKDALSEYNMVVSLLMDEVGVAPSEAMKETYQMILRESEQETFTMEDIIMDMSGDSEEGGAYYCNYFMFAGMLRFLLRRAERSGESAFLVEFELFGQKGKAIPPQRLKEATKAFHAATQITLRRSDIYTRISAGRFMVLLTSITYENCKLVSSRIVKLYKQYRSGYGIDLKYHAVSALAVKCGGMEDEAAKVSW